MASDSMVNHQQFSATVLGFFYKSILFLLRCRCIEIYFNFSQAEKVIMKGFYSILNILMVI